MMKKRIAALALSASLATTAVLAPQADARGPKGPKKDDKPAIFKLSSFKKDDKKKNKHNKKKGHGNIVGKPKPKKKHKKDDNKKSSYNLKGFHSSSKDGGKKHTPKRGR